MALLLVALGIGKHAVAKTRHRIHQDAGRQLTAGEHIVTNGNLFIYDLIQHTLINAFMTVALILYVTLSLSNVSVFLYFNF